MNDIESESTISQTSSNPKEKSSDFLSSTINYKEVFDQAGDYILLLEIVSGDIPIIRDMNDTALRIHGYTREQLINKPISFIDPNITPETAKARINAIQSGELVVFEVQHRKNDGTIIDAEAQVRLISIDGKQFILSIERDISDRKRLERKLDEQIQRFNLIVAGAKDGIWDWDVPNKRVLYSPRWKAMRGFSDDEISDSEEEWKKSIHPEDIQRVLASITAHFDGKTQWFNEDYRVKCKNGTWLWINDRGLALRDKTGKVIRMAGSETDITERKRTENELRLTKERFETIFNEAPLGIALIDSLTGHIYAANPMFAKIAGRTMEEMGNIDWMSITHPDDIKEDSDNMALLNAGKIPGFQMRKRYIRPDSNVVWINMTIAPVTVEDKTHPRHLCMIQDITENLKIEEQLRQAQKMESIGLLAGGVAHDFNNILQAVIGYGSMAKERLNNDPLTKEFVVEILNGANRAAELTRALLAYSRKQVIMPKIQNLNTIVCNIEKMIRRILREDIELRTILDSKDIMVNIDASQIDQVLLNLVTNARDAMPDGGSLIIKTGVAEINSKYSEAYSFENFGMYAVLTVSDTGIGMDLKTKKNIFEPFFTTKEVGKGTGLGLAMAYGIIKQHDGNINVYSEPGNGTTFRIYLPLIQKAEEISSEAFEMVPIGCGETILLAEDDATVRKIIGMYLQEHGYNTIEVQDGEEAVRAYKEHCNKISLLLFDIIMPKKNGKDAYEAIKKLSDNVKVIFTSGYTDEMVAIKGIHKEKLDFVSKPVNLDALLRKIRTVLNKQHV
ncbi:MAG: PAS domain S-box protein [Nitrospirae bacterium]|nr:PAS domain S-box protein [Nitrospirota bacterium]